MGGGRDVVEDADGPGWAAETDPVDDVADVPRWEGVDAFVPVGPDVLFGGDGRMVGECGEDVEVGAGVDGFNVLRKGLKFLRYAECGGRHDCGEVLEWQSG